MQWGAGARSLAMGRAFLAVSDDASATYWNPAAMVQIPRKELMGSQAMLFEQTSLTFFSYVHPTAKAGVWGLSMTQLTSGGFEKISVTEDPSSPPDSPDYLSIVNDGSFQVSQQAMTLAYGMQVTNRLAAGISFQQITNTVDTFKQSFMGIDASVFSRVNNNYRFALAIKNAVTQAPANSDDRLPLTVKVGNAFGLLRAAWF